MSEATDTRVNTGQVDRKKKLGRGLGALLGETRREEPLATQTSNDGNQLAQKGRSRGSPTEGLSAVPIAQIEPLPGQPRTKFDELTSTLERA